MGSLYIDQEPDLFSDTSRMVNASKVVHVGKATSMYQALDGVRASPLPIRTR